VVGDTGVMRGVIVGLRHQHKNAANFKSLTANALEGVQIAGLALGLDPEHPHLEVAIRTENEGLCWLGRCGIFRFGARSFNSSHAMPSLTGRSTIGSSLLYNGSF
jgi:hypothetical protein